jgi:hypothetical protein
VVITDGRAPVWGLVSEKKKKERREIQEGVRHTKDKVEVHLFGQRKKSPR